MSEESNDITLSVVVDRQDVAWLKQKAKLEERSVSAVVRQILKALRQAEPLLPQLNVKPGNDY